MQWPDSIFIDGIVTFLYLSIIPPMQPRRTLIAHRFALAGSNCGQQAMSDLGGWRT